MLKRIIYSVWSDLTEEHTSVNDYKKQSWKIYKNKLIELQKKYAYMCNADYEIFTPPVTDYVNVQFYKIFKFEELTKYYDEVIYFDLDIIPITNQNIFESFDFNKILIYSYIIDIEYLGSKKHKKYLIKCARENLLVDPMNRYLKLSAKKAMLLLHDINGNEEICNTGVFGGNKKAAETLDFSRNMKMIEKTLIEAKDDTLYPDVYSQAWEKNNEIYFSFLLEKFNIDFNNIGIQWNYILDEVVFQYTPGAHLIHQVNKDFYGTISRLE
jgi:hypothetical protein